MRIEQFKNKKLASDAGKKSSRKGIPNRMTELYRAMVQRQIDRKDQKPITLEDFRQDNYEGLLLLREDARTWQEKYLIESLISKLLHAQKVEHTGKDGKGLFEAVQITIVRSDEAQS